MAAGLGVSLLPQRCRLPAHRVLGAAEGFAEITGLELALYARADLPSAGRSLCEQLRELCAQLSLTPAG